MNEATTANNFSVFPQANTRLSKQEQANEGMLFTTEKIKFSHLIKMKRTNKLKNSIKPENKPTAHLKLQKL